MGSILGSPYFGKLPFNFLGTGSLTVMRMVDHANGPHTDDSPEKGICVKIPFQLMEVSARNMWCRAMLWKTHRAPEQL